MITPASGTGTADATPLAMAVVWTADRTALLDLLRQVHSDLGELYLQAVGALCQEQLSHPRLMIAGHCLRELFSKLPRTLGDPVKDRSDVNRPALELFRAWTGENLDLADVVGDEDDDSPRAVPAGVFRAARVVAAAAAVGNQNARELTAMLATGQIGNLDDGAVKRLHRAIEFFREWTHARDYSKPERILPTGEIVELELRIIEEAMLTRLGNMADRARAMRDIIAKANRRVTGGAP
ncbi:MAG TPA: hypothetical protein VMU94_30845 [Streptosporangiaceae bacterium]|nr:hypothetical protein [Streptosporangiaceae bacterium]